MPYSLKYLAPILLCALTLGCATRPENIGRAPPVDEVNNEKGLALKGFDPVAYFAEDKPREGSAAITSEWRGATYRFTSQEHRDEFDRHPDQYIPQFGGYCAFAVSQGATADGDPLQWAIVDQKLYVNNNAFAAKLWNQGKKGHIQTGNSNWPLIPKHSLVAEPAVPAVGKAREIDAR